VVFFYLLFIAISTKTEQSVRAFYLFICVDVDQIRQ